jgi:hypothetical protein
VAFMRQRVANQHRRGGEKAKGGEQIHGVSRVASSRFNLRRCCKRNFLDMRALQH